LNRLFHILPSFLVLIILVQCAKIGSPSGGPRDIAPPVLLKSKPLNKSTRFLGKQIEFTFDEFINTQGMSQELVISPPMEETPEIRMRGKTLVIEFMEDLRENTTYTLSFGETIKDLNEGNILRNFEFVFSTGEKLDSLGVLGMAVQAFDLELPKMEDPFFVMLYENLSDSAPLLEMPDYIGKITPQGAFLINNIRPGTYRLFALQDLNRSFKYDVPEEMIGFIDTTLLLDPGMFDYKLMDSLHMADSLLVDSLETDRQEDSLGLEMEDSLIVEISDSVMLAELGKYSVYVDIFLFQEDNKPQYLADYARDDRRKLSLYFNRELTQRVRMEPYNFDPAGDWFLLEEHVMKDTLDYWLKDSLVYKRDSLQFLAQYPVTDSLQQIVTYYDTLKFNYREPQKATARRRRQAEKEKQEEKITLSTGVSASQPQDIYRPISIEVQHPVFSTDQSRISLTRKEDTLVIPVPFTLVKDSTRIRRYFMKVDWESEIRYFLDIYPGAFIDIYGITHDTISTNFLSRSSEWYGRILLNLSGVDGPKIIQLLDKDDKIVRVRKVTENGVIEFPFLGPAAFTLKIVHDDNGNGKWDTGSYLEGIQPERVSYNPETITIRSNFDMEINWNLKEGEDPVPENDSMEGPG
jgi:uncharacterized protein (DUF2141 family)